ncbi:MAG: hypothetical protein ACYTG0_22880 [Planctomycetota bacterium]|jgi:integrase
MAERKKSNDRYKKLTWCASTNRWRKIHKGKTKYFPLHDNETKATSYKRCLEACRKWMVEVDETPAPVEDLIGKLGLYAIEEAIDLLTEAERTQNPVLFSAGMVELQKAQQIVADQAPHTGIKPGPPFRPWDLVDINTDSVAQTGPPTIAQAVALWLDHKQGMVTGRRLRMLKIHLNEFASIVGPDKPVTDIGNVTLSTYLADRKRRIRATDKPEKLSKGTVTPQLNQVTQFVDWCHYDQGYIAERPSLLREKRFKIPGGKRTAYKDTFSRAEYQALLSVANDRQRAYWLLAANCGFLQNDIGRLLHGEIIDDGHTMRIQRVRNKTHDQGDVPEVTWLLWQDTAKYLRMELARCKGKHPEYALVNTTGGILWQDKPRIDSISGDWQRCRDRLGGELKPLKAFRNTGATLLEQHDIYMTCKPHWLGHAPTTQADTAYSTPSQDRFDAAIRWLAEQLGVA